MANALMELKAACSSQPLQSAVDLIGAGETTWFMGRPASAPEGTIALSQAGRFKIIVRDEDIRNVEKHKDAFFVEVSAESHIAISLEMAIKASFNGCGCSKPEASGSPAALTTGTTGDAQREVIYWNVGNCAIRMDCHTIAGKQVCLITSVTCSYVNNLP